MFPSQPRYWLLTLSLSLFGLTSCTTPTGKSSAITHSSVDLNTPILKAALMVSHQEREQPVCNTITIPESITDPAQQQQYCDTYGPPPNQQLCQTKEYWPEDGVLSTSLKIAKQNQCVAVFDSKNNQWSYKPQNLRNYGYDTDTGTNYAYPGPTYWLRRASEDDPNPNYRFPGDRFKLRLHNNMGATTVAEQEKCTPPNTTNFTKDTSPNCFHGFETTNFHFHGFHISPQPHQDYVLLKLFPTGSNITVKPPQEALGHYDYDLPVIPHNQAEGTHWFHPHHHGATAIQVLNGMAGTFLVTGPFDYWLNDYYGYYDYNKKKPKLKDHLLVIQQVNDLLGVSPSPLVNGQAQPFVTIQRGETQRWRFVSATMNAAANLAIDFGTTGCLEVRQIAMDGVQFGKGNYDTQPLLDLSTMQLELSSGNRVDFLVRVPPDAADSCFPDGQLPMTFQRKLLNELKVQTTQPTVAGGTLFQVVLNDRILDMKKLPTKSDWPALPEFLKPPAPVKSDTIVYSQHGAVPAQTVVDAPVFKIDGKQFEHHCVPDKMTHKLNSEIKWTVSNKLFDNRVASGFTGDQVKHPFHIHTNPFYLTRNGNTDYEYGIWQDTIALPSGNNERSSSVDILMRFEDYTGGFVQHCHILGHEDRGMMSLVQTICEDTSNGNKFGQPTDGVDNCEPSGQSPALPVCSH